MPSGINLFGSVREKSNPQGDSVERPVSDFPGGIESAKIGYRFVQGTKQAEGPPSQRMELSLGKQQGGSVDKSTLSTDRVRELQDGEDETMHEGLHRFIPLDGGGRGKSDGFCECNLVCCRCRQPCNFCKNCCDDGGI